MAGTADEGHNDLIFTVKKPELDQKGQLFHN